MPDWLLTGGLLLSDADEVQALGDGPRQQVDGRAVDVRALVDVDVDLGAARGVAGDVTGHIEAGLGPTSG